MTKYSRTYDCAPTLTDTQVLEFCKNGFLMLEGIVPDEINRRTVAYCNAHPLWHRRSASTVSGLRNLLKYNYFRTVTPERDWVRETDFDFATADYALHGAPTFRQQFRDCSDSAQLFLWLCGQSDQFHVLGGQSWPIPAHRLDVPFGTPAGLLKHTA